MNFSNKFEVIINDNAYATLDNKKLKHLWTIIADKGLSNTEITTLIQEDRKGLGTLIQYVDEKISNKNKKH